MHLLHAMTGTNPAEIVSLHHAGKTTPFRDAGHINMRNAGEYTHIQHIADGRNRFTSRQPKLANKPEPCIFAAEHRLFYQPWQQTCDVTGLRARTKPARLGSKPELDR